MSRTQTVTPNAKIVPHLWYGVSWQIVPTVRSSNSKRPSMMARDILGKMMTDPDRARARRVTEAMLQMKKFDIARLEQAYGAPTTAKA